MSEPLRQQTEILDANLPQRAASKPQESIWVAASAGTGKTKVLTDRVLRLLLPREDGQGATPPNRILCLTFTKAAANEMAMRINETLGKWAVMEVEALEKTLHDLLGVTPTPQQIEMAQRLFADVVDCPGGLQIKTIHSFCKSVLGRFPIEADLPANFSELDEGQANDLVKQAQTKVLRLAQLPEQKASPLAQAFYTLSTALDEDRFSKLINDVVKERFQLRKLMERYKTLDNIFAGICDHYDIDPMLNADAVAESLCADGAYDETNLRRVAEAMLEDGSKQGPERGATILEWFNATYETRVQTLDNYSLVFLTKEREIRSTKGFPVKAVCDAFPECTDILQEEARRIYNAHETIKRIQSAQMTRDILVMGMAVLEEYTKIKQEQGALDFDDLIIRTMELLGGNTHSFRSLGEKDRVIIPNWIMYKLDQGLDHILVDEAQDTNPEQWRIVESLTMEFFEGQSARDDVLRTSFTVGDIKQSIYRFQRAAPEEFQRMRGVLHERITKSGHVNRDVALDISFRSTASILHVVDRVFADPELNEAVGGGTIAHSAFRDGQEGLVELWPVFEDDEKVQKNFWDPPTRVISQQSGASHLAASLAQEIRNWLDRKEILKSYDRPVEPGDIMILVRSRSSFVDQLIRELKKQNIPVSGSDRMILSEQLVVQDLFALAEFCMLHDDDLTLASVLKSPFFGWSEEELFSLCYNRKGTLWQELCNFDSDRITSIENHPEPILCVDSAKREAARDYLSRLMGRARYLGAYEFFSHILTRPCPADAQSGLRAIRGRLGDDALDPLDELLNACLDYGRDHVDHVQLFLEHQRSRETKIKREMEESAGQVRIMTVHGSKGLQAPIVILPDTIKSSSARKTGRLLWPDKTNIDIPLFSARKDDDPTHYQNAYNYAQSLDDQEYYRLLYVAMTRAADRLYIAGYKGSKSAPDSSWYFKIREAMEKDPACRTTDDQRLQIHNEQTEDPDKAKEKEQKQHSQETLPSWAQAQAPQEDVPPKPLIPSRPSLEDQETATSPLIASDQKRFRRGNVTHKLLQFLPDFKPETRRDIAEKFVQKNGSDLSRDVQQNIISEVMVILDNPAYEPFFAQNSLAEVSVTGLMPDNRIVSGQIDRLVMNETDIWIIDYKTNRPPPKDPKDVPALYHKQMAAYRDSLQAIYPKHTIHTALLWTDGPYLTVL